MYMNRHPLGNWFKGFLILLLAILLVGMVSQVKSMPQDSIVYVEGVPIDIHIMDNYCKGWEDGYEDGYCYEQVACLPPLVPLCPTKRINDKPGYQGGYERGFVAGRKKRNNGK